MPAKKPPKGSDYLGGVHGPGSKVGSGRWVNKKSGRTVGTSTQEDSRYTPVKPKTSVSKNTRKK